MKKRGRRVVTSTLSGVKQKSMSTSLIFPSKMVISQPKTTDILGKVQHIFQRFGLLLSGKTTRIGLSAIFARIFIDSRQYVIESLI